MPIPLTGQITVSSTAQQIDAGQAAGKCVAFTIRAPLSNAHSVFVGASGVTSETGHQLDAGDELSYERRALNGQPFYQSRPADFWVVGTVGDVVTWLALE